MLHKVNLVFLFLIPSLALGSFNFQYDYNLVNLPDNTGNVALSKKMSAFSITDSTNIGDSASGSSLSIGYDWGFFGVQGKYIFEHKADSQAGIMNQPAGDFGATTTEMNWSGYGADVYLKFNRKGKFRPLLGLGFASFDVNLQQNYVQLSGSGLPTNPVNSTGTASGIYYYAGANYNITNWFGLGLKYTMYNATVDKLYLEQATKFSNGTAEQPAGQTLKYLNSDATGFDGEYEVDLGYSEMTISLFFSF
jgi:hypothetical protein